MLKVSVPALLCILAFSLFLGGCAQPTVPAPSPSPSSSIDESLIPVATARILATGHLASSSGNVSVTYNTTGLYQVSVANVTFDDSYSVQLTPTQNSKAYMNSYLLSGNLYCCAYNETGAAIDTDFSIAVWKNKVVAP
jgi:hypothetical protein